jgi:pantoate--beta-alanine ligase
MQQEVARLLAEGKTIALVPTMGYLHDGHVALLREGRKHGDVLILSIFVNPKQFGPSEDFQAYPRDLNRDLSLAEYAQADLVFTPEVGAMYETGHQTFVEQSLLPQHLCGLSRPGHFRGVATVVAKLFNIVKPHVAVFGEKDYQQLAIVRQMVRDLNFDIRIIGVPTVRELDGLAMSSRNAYLSEEERASALSLWKTLRQAQESVARGIRDAGQLLNQASDLIEACAHTRIDYVALCDPETLEEVSTIEGATLMALAVWVGKTRLIDNALLRL